MKSAVRLLPIVLIAILFLTLNQVSYIQTAELNYNPDLISHGNVNQTMIQADFGSGTLNINWRIVLAIVALAAVGLGIMIIRAGRRETYRKFYSPSLDDAVSFHDISRFRAKREKRVFKSKKHLKAA